VLKGSQLSSDRQRLVVTYMVLKSVEMLLLFLIFYSQMIASYFSEPILLKLR
jgi:hypothetical protein